MCSKSYKFLKVEGIRIPTCVIRDGLLARALINHQLGSYDSNQTILTVTVCLKSPS